jgi:hypothetical protein
VVGSPCGSEPERVEEREHDDQPIAAKYESEIEAMYAEQR